MSKSVGRNDPCPCGSGKKYKKCCAQKDQAVVRERVSTQRGYELFDDTVVALGRWLSLDHPRAIDETPKVVFRALYSENEAEAMPDRMEAHEQADALTWNGIDAALAYWAPSAVANPTFADLDACEQSLRDQLREERGPRLEQAQWSCVHDLLSSPPRVYRVRRYEPNETLVLEDLATGDEVTYPYPTATFQRDDVFATRVVDRSSGGRCMMSYLPIDEPHRGQAIEAVQAYDAAVGDEDRDSEAELAARRTLFLAIWRAWLAPYAAPTEALADGDEQSGDSSDGTAASDGDDGES